MSITATERTQIIDLIVMMFEAAPGATYLSQIVAMYEANGHSRDTLAAQLDDTTVHQGLNPPTQTLCAFTSELLGPLNLSADAFATDFVASRWVAGATKGQIACEALQALDNVAPSAAPQYLWAHATLINKAAVAEYYSVTLGQTTTDIQALRAVIADVTADSLPPIWIEPPWLEVPGVFVSVVGSAPIELSSGH
jgi:hypothetical protein